jgi:ketosteroid isomerase-like protein
VLHQPLEETAMTTTNPLAAVQAVYEAFGRGDLPALLAQLQPDVRWQFLGDRRAPYTRTVTGHDGVARWFGQVAEADGIQAFEPREFLAGPEHVTVIGWERTAALPGGQVFECEWVHVWRLRDGRVASFWGMLDSEAAARART